MIVAITILAFIIALYLNHETISRKLYNGKKLTPKEFSA